MEAVSFATDHHIAKFEYISVVVCVLFGVGDCFIEFFARNIVRPTAVIIRMILVWKIGKLFIFSTER